MSGAGPRVRWIVRVLAAIAIALAVAGAGLELRHLHEMRLADSGEEAVGAAADQVPALLSYESDTVDQQLHDAASGLAPSPYRDRFTDTIESTVIPTSEDKSISTSADVVGSALVSSRDDGAVVLLLIDQRTTSATTGVDSPPDVAGSRVEVTMTRDGDEWRIEELRPV
ncbi:MAG: h domain protein [Tomitella sp.]|nr:h domain protein [Tomitella sp.]